MEWIKQLSVNTFQNTFNKDYARDPIEHTCYLCSVFPVTCKDTKAKPGKHEVKYIAKDFSKNELQFERDILNQVEALWKVFY